MKVLIIGGTGPISTAITRYLVERRDDAIPVSVRNDTYLCFAYPP